MEICLFFYVSLHLYEDDAHLFLCFYVHLSRDILVAVVEPALPGFPGDLSVLDLFLVEKIT